MAKLNPRLPKAKPNLAEVPKYSVPPPVPMPVIGVAKDYETRLKRIRRVYVTSGAGIAGIAIGVAAKVVMSAIQEQRMQRDVHRALGEVALYRQQIGEMMAELNQRHREAVKVSRIIDPQIVEMRALLPLADELAQSVGAIADDRAEKMRRLEQLALNSAPLQSSRNV